MVDIIIVSFIIISIIENTQEYGEKKQGSW